MTVRALAELSRETYAVHWSRDRPPHDKVRTVVDSFQVFDLSGRQKSPDLLQGPCALDRVFEMSLRGGIPSGDDEEDLS